MYVCCVEAHDFLNMQVHYVAVEEAVLAPLTHAPIMNCKRATRCVDCSEIQWRQCAHLPLPRLKWAAQRRSRSQPCHRINQHQPLRNNTARSADLIALHRLLKLQQWPLHI